MALNHGVARDLAFFPMLQGFGALCGIRHVDVRSHSSVLLMVGFFVFQFRLAR